MVMQEFNMVNGSGSSATKVHLIPNEPSTSPPTFFNRDSEHLVEQYVISLDNKLEQAIRELADAQKDVAEAQKDTEEQARQYADAQKAWEKEREELTNNRDELAAQLSQLQMRQAEKATKEFTAYWDEKKKQAQDDSSSSAAALVKAEGHIKSLQETNANLCYRLSEMRQDLIRLEAAAAKTTQN